MSSLVHSYVVLEIKTKFGISHFCKFVIVGRTIEIKLIYSASLWNHFQAESLDYLEIDQMSMNRMSLPKCINEVPILNSSNLSIISSPHIEHIVPIQ